MKNKYSLLLSILTIAKFAFAQEKLPILGLTDKRPTQLAFTNAVLHVSSSKVLDSATLLIKDNKVFKYGKKLAVPSGFIVKNLAGKHIYPGFIDLYSTYGMPIPVENQLKKGTTDGETAQFASRKPGPFHWNQAIHPEENADELFQPQQDQSEELRKLGFTSVLTGSKDGIMRGTAAFVSLGDLESKENLLLPKAANLLSFSKGSSRQNYPSSQMGSIALLRQTYLDAQWYKDVVSKKEQNLSLEAIVENAKLVNVFETTNWMEVLRAIKIAKEFGLNVVAKGKGDEYQRAEDLQKAGAKLILPLQFPEGYAIEDPSDADLIEYSDLKHYEMAPFNALKCKQAGLKFAFSISDLKDKKTFWTVLKKLMDSGLTEQDLVEAFCETPAKFIGADQLAGTLENGRLANFFISNSKLGTENFFIYESWILGKSKSFKSLEFKDLRGQYDLKIKNKSYPMFIEGGVSEPEVKLNLKDTVKTLFPGSISDKPFLLNIRGKINDLDTAFESRISLYITDTAFSGFVLTTDNQKVYAKAVYKAPSKAKTTPKPNPVPQGITFPFQAYGNTAKPKEGVYLIQNATLYTNEQKGILKETDLVISNGKIEAIGKGLKAPANAIIIDGKNKFVTSGIIDEHSHIAISNGVNEGSQAITAEVRIGDVVNSEDINIFRHLAGGVTAVQQLHGSANCIGGQSSLIKMRWGALPDDMKIKDADGFIKFALGENVKQSNWGENNTIRYPQTRMGVEQIYVDAFSQAKSYSQKWKAFNLNPNNKTLEKPARNLRLETISEILDNKRFITCHSYVQTEIAMLTKVADSLGFKVNTFTHILEGYKVADKLKMHGANASTFSDWWAYKMEVKDAIPYNAALLAKYGVNTCINSDDAEMARRLNREAAKTIKYGGLDEENAWKTITLNPAKALHLDKKMGSLKVGKDADVVIWNENPLSQIALAEKTFVDGILYFERDKLPALKKQFDLDKNRIINQMLKSKKPGQNLQKPTPKLHLLWDCEDLVEDNE